MCLGDRTHEVNQQFVAWGGEGIVMGGRDWSRSGTMGLLPKQRVGEWVTEDRGLHPVPSRSYERSEWCSRLFSSRVKDKCNGSRETHQGILLVIKEVSARTKERLQE